MAGDEFRRRGMQLSLSSDGTLTFSALNEAGFDIYLMKTPFQKSWR